jgi:Putative bacterial sensory transduction regulator
MENYTAEELLEILNGLGLPGEIVVDEDKEVSIEIELDDIEWSIELGSESPFYRSVLLTSVNVYEDAPHALVNSWNQNHITSSTYLLTNEETNEPIQTGSGLYIVVLRNSFPFFGSVTKEFIEFMFHCFHEDVCELFEIEENVEGSEGSPEEALPEHQLIPVLEQLQLELTVNPGQSARGLAKSLNISKYEVNHLLYGHTELFEKEGKSPPLWTNKGQISE